MARFYVLTYYLMAVGFPFYAGGGRSEQKGLCVEDGPDPAGSVGAAG